MLYRFIYFLGYITHHQFAVDISFLDKLFIYRQKIRRTATNVKGISRTTTIVTWVDELLAKINDALRIVSWRGTPPVDDIGCSSTTRSIESQKRHDVLRAVIQLPGMQFFPMVFFILTRAQFLQKSSSTSMLSWDPSTSPRQPNASRCHFYSLLMSLGLK